MMTLPVGICVFVCMVALSSAFTPKFPRAQSQSRLKVATNVPSANFGSSSSSSRSSSMVEDTVVEKVDYSHINQEINNPLEWGGSVASNRNLVYMPAYKAHHDMLSSLNMERQDLAEKYTQKFSSFKPARIANMEFKGDRFRKVRLTYFDGGNNVQVFNALWMPSFEYDVPMLGIDLISLGKQRILSVIDMQPLHPDQDYSDKYITRPEISSIRNKYPDLQGKLSGKIYDDTSFFSSNMLFGRFTDESKLKPVVHEALQEYLGAYIDMVSSAEPNHDPKAMEVVKKRQTQYDIYSAEKDPAVGLFDAYFGKEWSESFVHDFLFGLSNNAPHTNPVHNFKMGTGDNGPVIQKHTK